MIDSWTVYWITRLDGVGIGLTVLCILSFVLAGFLLFVWLIDSDRNCSEYLRMVTDDVHELLLKYGRRLLVVGAIGLLGIVAIPTTKEMAAIYLIPAIANSEKIQAEMSELYDLAKDYLKLQMRVPELEKENVK